MAVIDNIEMMSQLLQAAGAIKSDELDHAIKCAKQANQPLEQALLSLKLVSSDQLKPVLEAKQMIESGQVSLMVANQVLLTLGHGDVSFLDAFYKLKDKHESGQTLSAAPSNNPYADYFLAAHLVNLDQLNRALIESQSKNAPLGRTLVVNRFITRWALGEVVNAVGLIKQGKIKGKEAVHALREAITSHTSVIQKLFESGVYKGCSGETITLLELFVMAGCLTEADYFDLEELEVVEHKSFKEIVVERQLIEPRLVENAEALFNMIGTYLKPFQAADALRQLKTKDVSIYQAIAELKPPPQVVLPELRIGDLLVESGVSSREAVEKVVASNARSSLIRIGKLMLDAHLVSDVSIYNALRCQSLYREGIISSDQAVAVLSCAHKDKIKLEDAFSQFNLYVPSRMQWTWL